MKKTILMLLLAVIVMGLAFGVSGCAKKSVDMKDEMAAATVEDTAPKPGEPGYEKIYEESMAAKEESLEAQAAMDKKQEFLEGRTSAPLLPIYFDFDKSNIRLDQRSRIEKNADYLKKNSSAKIRIEGNCDERGTNEYNMALGERRAQSAKKYLINLGIHGDRMHTISFGEEKPLLHGHDEYSWAQNRRDDFVVVK
ncbi:MAG: peptidoglycan-associated lipoprotein Pal [Desulfobulbales bacterium]|nr:peptidoglycan-associated lipoprotein Pal [Desulfobulbales bacterium]